MSERNDALLVDRAAWFGQRPAILSEAGALTYSLLLSRSASIAASLLDGTKDLAEARIALLARPTADYVVGQWGIWRAGGVVVPICPDHPAAEMRHLLGDSKPAAVLVERSLLGTIEPLARALSVRLICIDDALSCAPVALPEVSPPRRAMMLYTSGTTSRPKGVVTTHANIAAQIGMLVKAWEWRAEDRILNFLPLHHIHGVINIIGCSLWSGACCEMMGGFDADAVWRRILDGRITLLMAVPTIYTRLIAAWEKATPVEQRAMSDACRKLRLMVSGSAPLPVSVLEKWRSISGHDLLERYGMTETGMLISNPLRGPRVPGCVGRPLPGVRVRLVDDHGRRPRAGDPGEIQVKGPGVFAEYWRQPEATTAAFVDGWFRTGDVAVVKKGVYRILGRSSIDIIKTGGYKVSAIEIEEVLREHAEIDQCAVVGIDDPEWGQRVAVAVVLKAKRRLGLEGLRTWAKQRLSVYKVPSRLLVVRELPRNAMGKVVKPEVCRLFAAKTVARPRPGSKPLAARS